MAKYLRPRRGTKTNAIGQNILLKRGEIFLEFQGDSIGNSRGKLIIGDGNTSYSSIKPFIEDPSLYIPQFNRVVGNSTVAIDNMGDGSSASTVTLPSIFTNIWTALNAISATINTNYNAATSKADNEVFSSTKNGLCPALAPNSYSQLTYLCADGQWHTPPNDNTTYDRATTDSNGLLLKLQNDTTKYLRASGSWQVPPDTTYGAPTTAAYGLIPQLPGDATTATKFLSGDGTWRVPVASGDSLTNDYTGNSTVKMATQTAAYNAYKDLTDNLFRTKNISAQIASIPANGLGSTWAAATMSGYHPIAIVGFNTGSTVLYLCTCLIETKNNVTGVSFAVRNVSSSRTATASANVLFIRDTV